jgi:hypothetical protein
MRPFWLVPILALSTIAEAQSPPSSCPAQPLPPAIDSAGPWDISEFTHAVSFAATPSLEHPGRAWVVRLSQEVGDGNVRLSISHLRSQRNCNRYDIERRWDATLAPQEYRSLIDALAPFAIPPANVLTNDREGVESVGIDGTGLVLRVQAEGWKVTRTIHHSSPSGAKISAIFHRLLVRHVAAEERPTEEWRTRTK